MQMVLHGGHLCHGLPPKGELPNPLVPAQVSRAASSPREKGHKHCTVPHTETTGHRFSSSPLPQRKALGSAAKPVGPGPDLTPSCKWNPKAAGLGTGPLHGMQEPESPRGTEDSPGEPPMH